MRPPSLTSWPEQRRRSGGRRKKLSNHRAQNCSLLPHLHMLSCRMSATRSGYMYHPLRASLTFQQPLGDAEGTHQVLREVQVGRLLTKLREALGQSCAPQPVLPRTQRHIEQMAWVDRAGVRGDGWPRRTPPQGADEH